MLLYAALELRLGIEARLREYLNAVEHYTSHTRLRALTPLHGRPSLAAVTQGTV